MKIVCIDARSRFNDDPIRMGITVGKVYDCLDLNVSKPNSCVRIVDDYGDDVIYWDGYFKSLLEVRNEKLEKILCE